MPPKQDAGDKGVPVSDFIPNSKEYDWHAASLVKPPVPMSPKETRTKTPWLIFAGFGVAVGAGSFWLGRRRRNTGSVDDQFSERRRVIATRQVLVAVPDIANVGAKKTVAPPAAGPPVSSGAFDLFLDRANLLTGRNSGPDMGRW